jgi:hypothetical protein
VPGLEFKPQYLKKTSNYASGKWYFVVENSKAQKI